MKRNGTKHNYVTTSRAVEITGSSYHPSPAKERPDLSDRDAPAERSSPGFLPDERETEHAEGTHQGKRTVTGKPRRNHRRLLRRPRQHYPEPWLEPAARPTLPRPWLDARASIAAWGHETFALRASRPRSPLWPLNVPSLREWGRRTVGVGKGEQAELEPSREKTQNHA